PLSALLLYATLFRSQVLACLNEGDTHGASEPSPWVVRFAGLAPSAAIVLDVAAGSGRHTRLFVERGHRAVAVDRDTGALPALGADRKSTRLNSSPCP